MPHFVGRKMQNAIVLMKIAGVDNEAIVIATGVHPEAVQGIEPDTALEFVNENVRMSFNP